ncbi:MAG: RNA polymerase sigma factor [Ignavibacteria bacterium]|nr:MAG: RNA polymerase sigma factor [Ignavibacteria bacterium]
MLFKSGKYRTLFDKYKNDVYSYALFLLKSEFDAEDAAQEVFIKLWNNMGKFKQSKAKQWLMSTTHNICIDMLRKRQRNIDRNLSFEDEIFVDSVDGNSLSYNHNVDSIQLLDTIEEAMKQLPVKLRSVFVLYELHGFKYKEIAEILELPINSVKVYLLRARKLLQKILTKYEVEKV